MSDEYIPAPGEYHPAWEPHVRKVQDWLMRIGDWGSNYQIQFARPSAPVAARMISDPNPPVSDIAIRVHTLTRRQCAGSAPYVGRPFWYLWEVATDELGRHVAAPVAHRRYDPRDDLLRWPDLEALPERYG